MNNPGKDKAQSVSACGAERNGDRMKKGMLRAGASLMAVSIASFSTAMAQARDFDIDAGPAEKTLNQFASQADVSVVYTYDAVEGYRTNDVDGSYEPEDALKLMTDGTGLSVFEGEGGAFAVRVIKTAAADSSLIRVAQLDQEDDVQEVSTRNDDDEAEQDVIIVTGTNIRGVAPDSSPSFVFNRDDIDKTGFGTVAEFVQSLPQNFGGGSNNDVISLNNDRTAAQNITSGSSVNLRGLGSGSTLVLLNGRRLAPAGGIGDFVDISLIPLSAIERIEVLTDGASAIYGADAIAGVVNFVLRDDYDGAETFARFGGVTKGELNEYRVGQTIGKNWSTGNLLASYEFFRRDSLGAESRSFSSSAALPLDLLPEQESHNFLVTGSQQLNDRIKLRGQAMYSQRDSSRTFTTSVNSSSASETEQYGGGISAEIGLWEDWLADISGSYHKVEAFVETTSSSFNQTQTNSDLWSINAKIDGTAFETPGGQVKLALGTEFRSEGFTNLDVDADINVASDERDVFAAFGEVFIPIVGSSNRMYGFERFEITAAGRFEDYSDFGTTLNPKVGVLWSPAQGLDFRGTYSTSFNPPNLGDTGNTQGSAAVATIPDPGSMSGLSVVVFDQRTDPNIGPEEATVWTAGADFTTEVESGKLDFAITFFSIEYEGRIDRPTSNPIFALSNPDIFADLIFRNPDTQAVADIVADAQSQLGFFNFSFGGWTAPGDEDVLVDLTLQNLARTETKGLDFSAAYSLPTAIGDFAFGFNGNKLFEIERALTATAPSFDVVDTFANPVDFRLRGSAAWSLDGLTANVFVNHVGAYVDNTTSIDEPINSWTTIDLNLGFEFGEISDSQILSDTRVSLSVLNLFDEEPPAVAIQPFALAGFDATNADPLGRFIAFQITKRW